MQRIIALFLAIPLIASVSACSNGSAATPGSGGGRGRGGRGGESGPVPVVTGMASEKDVPVDIPAIGNVEAYNSISVRSQVTGTLTEVLFHEGDSVKKGDHLFTIDPRPYQAQLTQAEANLKRDEALLAQAEAQLNRDAANAEYQQLQAERQGELTNKGIVSKDQAEQARSSADASSAAVKADRAAIDSAKAELTAQQAAVDNARVALSYTVIRSPIDGRTGNLAVKVGNLVTANTTELMTIAQIEPVYVTFAVPAVNLAAIKQHLAHKDPLLVTAVPQDGDSQSANGRMTFVDNAVDPTTDTIKLKATFANADRRLWPGQFARVSLRLSVLPHATVVPSEAVQTGQENEYVFVVKSDQTVEQRTITVGQRVGNDVVIEKGLRPGEVVVTEGQLRLEPGSRIQTGGGDQGAGDSGRRGGRSGRGRGQRQG